MGDLKSKGALVDKVTLVPRVEPGKGDDDILAAYAASVSFFISLAGLSPFAFGVSLASSAALLTS